MTDQAWRVLGIISISSMILAWAWFHIRVLDHKDMDIPDLLTRMGIPFFFFCVDWALIAGFIGVPPAWRLPFVAIPGIPITVGLIWKGLKARKLSTHTLTATKQGE